MKLSRAPRISNGRGSSHLPVGDGATLHWNMTVRSSKEYMRIFFCSRYAPKAFKSGGKRRVRSCARYAFALAVAAFLPTSCDRVDAEDAAWIAPKDDGGRETTARSNTDDRTGDDAQAIVVECANGAPAPGGMCRCGDQDLTPDEARFWQCVLPQAMADSPSGDGRHAKNEARQYMCYRASGCYAKGNRYPQGTAFRNDAAWCGTHRHPGGNYACVWDADRHALRWDCVGACQCGDIRVQIVDGRVLGGDLPLGYENFECDDADGNAPAGYRAVTGHEYCADLPMMKGQTCRNQTIFCGAHSESMPYDSGYICHHQKMICITPPCSCGSTSISYRAECRNQQVFCNDTPYPSLPDDGDYICTERGWMCMNRLGCKSPTQPVSTFAVYSIQRRTRLVRRRPTISPRRRLHLRRRRLGMPKSQGVSLRRPKRPFPLLRYARWAFVQGFSKHPQYNAISYPLRAKYKRLRFGWRR